MLWCFNSVYFVTPLKNCDPIVSWKVQFRSSMEGLFEEQNSWDVFVKAETPSVECFCSLERLASPWTSLPSERPASAFSLSPGSLLQIHVYSYAPVRGLCALVRSTALFLLLFLLVLIHS